MYSTLPGNWPTSCDHQLPNVTAPAGTPQQHSSKWRPAAYSLLEYLSSGAAPVQEPAL